MPSLQIRDLPEDIYTKLCLIAKAENRSLAQQTIVLLRESLGLRGHARLRRNIFLENLEKDRFSDIADLDVVQMIREDRER